MYYTGGALIWHDYDNLTAYTISHDCQIITPNLVDLEKAGVLVQVETDKSFDEVEPEEPLFWFIHPGKSQ